MKDYLKEFDEKVNELRGLVGIDDNSDSIITPFGYKTRRGDELFTVVDWGNIKSHISKLIQEVRENEREEVAKEIFDIGHNDDCMFCGFKDRKCKDITALLTNK